MEPYPGIYIYKQIVQAKLFIDNHYDEPIRLMEIADEAYFSKFHFIRLFKRIYHTTPHQYLIQVRIEKAKLKLQQGCPVSEVCTTVGFDSISSFAGLFKRRVGITPSAYQIKQEKRRKDMADTPLRYVPHCFAENNGWVKR